MTQLGNSRSITTNQNGLNEKLDEIVLKHLHSEFKKPFAQHSLQAFGEIELRVSEFLSNNPDGEIILDSCCGVGESSLFLAKQNPEHLVIGIDKSEYRLDKNQASEQQKIVGNLLLIRGDLNDLWRMINTKSWPIISHYILYPNPWPKSKHLQRRWHGAPVFKTLLTLSRQVVVRSNWPIYIQEFGRALELAGVSSDIEQYRADIAMTPFERKYWASGQLSYQLKANL